MGGLTLVFLVTTAMGSASAMPIHAPIMVRAAQSVLEIRWRWRWGAHRHCLTHRCASGRGHCLAHRCQ